MTTILNNLSIIIPIAPKEESWVDLWTDLEKLPIETEIIFSGPKMPREALPSRVKWVNSAPGRAQQLNTGARHAIHDFLWFLHADSRFTKTTLASLTDILKCDSNIFYYFNLQFLNDGPLLMLINEIGCWIRSRLMGLPFGDQGFCLSKINFERIGGFPEDVPYGEDHVFVWRAHQRGISIQSTKNSLKTSARKYKNLGWFHITKLYYKLWTTQARPERKKLKQINSGQTTAIAVFVKTPTLTPFKTRLATTIGKEFTLTFYELCLETIQNTLVSLNQSTLALICPYWAIAEKQGLSDQRWNAFSRIWQNDGNLGEKLHHIYSSLQTIHRNVLLIGADAPQLSQQLILKAHQILQNKSTFVIGPARDGGFYLFGGSVALPKDIWTSIAYSQSQTCNDLLIKIKNYGDVFFLPTLSDVDVYDDLSVLSQELQHTNQSEQKKISHWVDDFLKKDIL